MTTKTKLLALLNNANAGSIRRALSETDVVFGTPVSDITSSHNTKITLTAISQSGYQGHVDVFYNRVSMNDQAIPDMLISEDTFSILTIMPQLDKHANASLEQADLNPFVVPAMEVGDIVTVSLTAKDSSLGWIGTKELELLYGLPPNLDELNTLLTETMPSSGYLA